MDNPRTLESVASLLRIGLLCSNELPADRPETGDIIKELQIVSDVFIKSGVRGEMVRQKPTEGKARLQLLINEKLLISG